MTTDYAPYIQKGFRHIAHEILHDVSENGFTGDSHLFITFQTSHPGVEIPLFVREKYPTEMSIILQHQYENLNAGTDAFSVDLTFGGTLCRLVVPYTALVTLSDPSAQFGLQFIPEHKQPKPEQNADIIDLSSRRKNKK